MHDASVESEPIGARWINKEEKKEEKEKNKKKKKKER